jgi:beta-alanine degradation protein BauB
MSHDPAETNPDLYKVIFENARVRVLEYRDRPGDKTSPHRHPDSVMYTLASFTRRLTSGDRQAVVELERGQARWLDAQEHAGENIGETDTHALFIELKEPAPTPPGDAALGPD